ncbi:hypothetical protein AN189_18160, partial [Loktanella sp. 3ANDIMAR09]|uniref:hypothetical protein n=1 Tax=Loktanella sp. 3ANDIMAR09 TaxID=1225657 RepID=UPI0006FD7DCD
MTDILNVTDGSRTTVSVTRAEALELGYPETAIAEAEARAAAQAARDAIRGRIDRTAGDVPSLLGATADTAAVALLGVLAAVAALDDARTAGSTSHNEPSESDAVNAWLYGFRARLAAMGDDLPAQADAFLKAVAAGAIRVPALAKGFDRVVSDIANRSTAVADAMT